MFLIRKLMFANLLLCAGLVSPVIASTPAAAVEEWVKYTSEENGFLVELPKKPNHVDQSIDVPKTNLKIRYSTFVSEPSESAVYVVSVWHYPTDIDMSRPEVNLKDGFSGMLSALPGSKVIENNVEEYNGFKSLNFLVKNEDIYFQGRLILVYNTLYQVFTVYKESEAPQMKADYCHFIDSFKLLHPEKNKTAASSAPKMNV